MITMIPDPRDQVDIPGLTPLMPAGGEGVEERLRIDGQPRTDGLARPWLGLYFRCARVYTRAYRDQGGQEYLGRCPRCGKCVRFAVGTGGTSERRFEVSCTT